MKTFLTFIKVLRHPGWTTDRWEVWNDEEFRLGYIEWLSGWRQYVYYQFPNMIMSTGCLQEIVDFIKSRMLDRKVAQSQKERVAE